MGETRIDVQILSRGKRKEVSLLVDTGATLTMVPEKILKNLRIKKIEEVGVEIADGRVVKRRIGEAKILVNGKSITTRIIFGKKQDASVLGTVVLEGLGLAVDPVRKRLVPVNFLLI